MTLLGAILLGGVVIMGIQSHAAQTAASETFVTTGAPSQGPEDPFCLCAFPFQPQVLDPPCTEDVFCFEVFDDVAAACIGGFCFESGAESVGIVVCESDQVCMQEAGGDSRARCVRTDQAFLLTDIPCALPPEDDARTYCTGNPCVISGEHDVVDGANVDFGDRAVVLEGTLSVSDGSMTILAGEFRIGAQGQLDGSDGIFGGSFDIITTGDIRIDGEREAGAINLVAEEGGFLSLTSESGSILGAGDILFGSSSDEGDGGTIDLRAGGDINLGGSLDAAGGSAGRGGELEVFAGGDVTLNGGINLTGGDDGGLLFVEALGSVTLGDITLDGTGDRGNGGEIDIRAGGAIELGGAIHARGSDLSPESCGDGGRLSLEAGGDLNTIGEIDLSALEGDCRGGEIELVGDSIDIGGPISFSGEGEGGFGGSLDVEANNGATCGDSLDGDGPMAGGSLLMTGTILVTTLECVIDSGTIELQIECSPILCGPLVIGGPIIAGPAEERSPQGPGPRGVVPTVGGSISISGCSVEIAETAQVLARGPDAFNRITSRGSTTVAGDMTATSANEFRFRPGFEPVITGQVVPAPSLIVDDTLQPCGLPTETPAPTAIPTATASRTPTPVATVTPISTPAPSASATPGSTTTATPSHIGSPSPTATGTRTPGPSSPTPTASQTPDLAGPGDANCDGRISAADLVELATLIPSSDPGDCGLADADQSGAVDELDIPATVRLIFE